MGDKVRDERQPGHWWADNELIDVYGPKIGAYGVAVYALLCRYADNKSGEAFPAIRTIAKQLSISRPTVSKTLNVLVEHKLIKIKKRYVKGTQERENNVYILLTLPKVVNDVYHVVKEIDDGGKSDLPQVVNDVASKKTQLKKTKEKGEGANGAPAPATAKTKERHPFVVAFQEQFRRNPNKTQTLELEQLPAADIDRWRDLLHRWALSGWNPSNIGGMIDRYKKESPPGATSKTRIVNGQTEQFVGGVWYPVRTPQEAV